MAREQILIEIQIFSPQGEILTHWFVDVAVITPDQPGLTRLSGNGMRHHLYFCHGAGKQRSVRRKEKERYYDSASSALWRRVRVLNQLQTV